MMKKTTISVPAIEFRQNGNRLYSFVINGKKIPLFASIARIKRGEKHLLAGYQRPQVISHITEIRQYLESAGSMIPNAIVIAFDNRVKFKGAAPANGSESRLGYLRIPVDAGVRDAPKSGWIVDGQQRMTAIQEADIRSFPMCIVAFVAPDERSQREHFIRVNSAKPLPRDLIDELIPETDTLLDSTKQKRKFPLKLRNQLNQHDESPFQGRIKTPTTPSGYIASSSVLRMLDNSLSNGVLFRHRRIASDDEQAMVSILFNYWTAVQKTFPVEWNLPPSKSRLTHGAGIISLGLIMDAICDRLADKRIPSKHHFCVELEKIRPHCHWVEGEWDLGRGIKRRWNDLQNIPRDIEALANHLVNCYREAGG
jgi:DGQHR domain-containing protein